MAGTRQLNDGAGRGSASERVVPEGFGLSAKDDAT